MNEGRDSKKNVALSMEERVQGLIAGTLQPSGEYVSFVVSRTRKCVEQATQLQQQLVAARAQVKALEQGLAKSHGAIEQYAYDIEHWLKQADEGSSPLELPMTSPAPQNGVHEESPS